jgi:hypothetical protein
MPAKAREAADEVAAYESTSPRSRSRTGRTLAGVLALVIRVFTG